MAEHVTGSFDRALVADIRTDRLTAGNRFAALDQINKGNIDKLQVAWTFCTGDIPESTGAGAEDQNTPLQIGDTVYTCTAYGKSSLDADTGAQRWKFDPQGTAPNWQRCRGLGYSDTLASPDNPPTACAKRLFLPTGDAITCSSTTCALAWPTT